MWSLLVVALLACGPRSQPRRGVPGDGGLVERFDRDPQAVIAEVVALDGLERELAVVALRAARPDSSGPLCEALDPGRIRARCERLDPARPVPSYAAAYWLELPASLRPEAAAGAPACPSGAVWCLAEAARAAAMRGQVATAAADCAALPDPLLVDDCALSAAERLPPGPGRLAAALRLCAAAGRFAARCHADRVGELVPTLAHPVTAERLVDGARAVQRAWAELDRTRIPRALDLYWAMAAGRVLAVMPDLPTGLLASLPATTGAHQRSARALRAIGADDPLAAARASASLPPSSRTPARAVWQRTPPVAPPLRRVPFDGLRGGVRPIHPDPAIDLGLAVLTAAAVTEPPRLDVLEGVVRGEEPAVLRWAAASLLAELAPGHPALAVAAADPDPLVSRSVSPAEVRP